jgi:hypothetical protein
MYFVFEIPFLIGPHKTLFILVYGNKWDLWAMVNSENSFCEGLYHLPSACDWRLVKFHIHNFIWSAGSMNRAVNGYETFFTGFICRIWTEKCMIQNHVQCSLLTISFGVTILSTGRLAELKWKLNLVAFYGIMKFITVFTRALYCSLSWARHVHPASSHPSFLSYILILSSHSLKSAIIVTVSNNNIIMTTGESLYEIGYNIMYLLHTVSKSGVTNMATRWVMCNFEVRVTNETETDSVLVKL